MGDPYADDSATTASWAPLADSPGWFYDRATNATKYDENLYNSYIAEANRQQAAAAQLRQITSVSQSFRDPNDIALERAALDEQIRQHDQQAASDAVMQRFAVDKLNYEISQGNRAAAANTRAYIEIVTARQTATTTARTGLVQDARNLPAQLNYQAQVENARNALQAQIANEQARQQNIDAQRQVGNDLASYTRNPSDAAALSAYLMSRDGSPAGPSAISQLIATGQDARTPEALLPGAQLLMTRDALAKGPTVITPSMVSAPNVPIPTFADAPAYNPTIPVGAPGGPQYGGGGGGSSAANGAAFGIATDNPSGTTLAPTGYTPGIDAGGNLVATPAMAQGGTTTARLFRGNEQGAELYLNPTGAPIGVIPADQTAKLTKGKQVPGYADGTDLLAMDVAPNHFGDLSIATPSATTAAGTPSTPTPATPEDSALTAARNFLSQAGNATLARSPWAGKGIPTPVGVSAPGTSPYLQQVAAAIAAALRGVDPSLYLSEATNARPVGLSGVPTRRTR